MEDLSIASMTIRNLDEAPRIRLHVRAAEMHRSRNEHTRPVLRHVVDVESLPRDHASIGRSHCQSLCRHKQCSLLPTRPTAGLPRPLAAGASKRRCAMSGVPMTLEPRASTCARRVNSTARPTRAPSLTANEQTRKNRPFFSGQWNLVVG
jgi:plasmid stability protein